MMWIRTSILVGFLGVLGKVATCTEHSLLGDFVIEAAVENAKHNFWAAPMKQKPLSSFAEVCGSRQTLRCFLTALEKEWASSS